MTAPRNLCAHVLDGHSCAKSAGHSGFHAEGSYMWGTCDETVTLVEPFAVSAAGDPDGGWRG